MNNFGIIVSFDTKMFYHKLNITLEPRLKKYTFVYLMKLLIKTVYLYGQYANRMLFAETVAF